ncbi:hypothetical protein [Actinoplanes nipponensis]|uniref:hypothetical protein n=1 Tax=Actinoplanes nipponensis TaxID=135950 RepID=UPI0019424404|nr:hypothetical protein [Actinoplanes nipponensis]
MSWYYPKGWTDQEDGVEQVLIHYTWTPPEQWPDWTWGHEARVLQDLGGFPRQRLKVLRMPREVWDMKNGWSTPEYRFHYYFEVYQHGGRWTTDLFTEEIVYRDLEYADTTGWVTNICIYWSVGSWIAPVYSPMEEPRIPAGSEFVSTNYYSYGDKDRFHHEKYHLLRVLDLPHRFHARMWGPRGADLVQQYHIGRMYPPEEKSETWIGPHGPSAPGGDNCWTHHL